MEIRRNLAINLCLIKAARGFSLDELAEELEISRSQLQRYLNGTGNFTVSTVEHLATKLKVDPVALMSLADSEKDQ